MTPCHHVISVIPVDQRPEVGKHFSQRFRHEEFRLSIDVCFLCILSPVSPTHPPSPIPCSLNMYKAMCSSRLDLHLWYMVYQAMLQTIVTIKPLLLEKITLVGAVSVSEVPAL